MSKYGLTYIQTYNYTIAMCSYIRIIIIIHNYAFKVANFIHAVAIRTFVILFSKAIDPDHDISDHHYYDNYTVYSYHCSNKSFIIITITSI